jgi:hypothetical protein
VVAERFRPEVLPGPLDDLACDVGLGAVADKLRNRRIVARHRTILPKLPMTGKGSGLPNLSSLTATSVSPAFRTDRQASHCGRLASLPLATSLNTNSQPRR